MSRWLLLVALAGCGSATSTNDSATATLEVSPPESIELPQMAPSFDGQSLDVTWKPESDGGVAWFFRLHRIPLDEGTTTFASTDVVTLDVANYLPDVAPPAGSVFDLQGCDDCTGTSTLQIDETSKTGLFDIDLELGVSSTRDCSYCDPGLVTTDAGAFEYPPSPCDGGDACPARVACPDAGPVPVTCDDMGGCRATAPLSLCDNPEIVPTKLHFVAHMTLPASIFGL